MLASLLYDLSNRGSMSTRGPSMQNLLAQYREVTHNFSPSILPPGLFHYDQPMVHKSIEKDVSICVAPSFYFVEQF